MVIRTSLMIGSVRMSVLFQNPIWLKADSLNEYLSFQSVGYSSLQKVIGLWRERLYDFVEKFN